MSMNDIITYLGDSVRPLKAGLDLFQSKHVINVGIRATDTETFNVMGEVIQTSNPRGLPHKITINGVKMNHVNNWKATCTCKAGLGHKCKHVFAVLLYVVK